MCMIMFKVMAVWMWCTESRMSIILSTKWAVQQPPDQA